MKSSQLALVLLVGPALHAATAATVSCPDLSTAVRVGTCPAEEELRQAFARDCGDGTKAGPGEAGICTDYGRYRGLKNVARWEAADGAFSADLSCELPTLGVRQAKASGIKVVKQEQRTLVVCHYAESVNFTYRTRAACRPAGREECVAASCKATCN